MTKNDAYCEKHFTNKFDLMYNNLN